MRLGKYRSEYNGYNSTGEVQYASDHGANSTRNLGKKLSAWNLLLSNDTQKE